MWANDLPFRTSFVDRDMFLRYTDLGVGHPVALRRTVRDCFSLRSSAPVDAMIINEGGGGDGEGLEVDDDERVDVDLADDELEEEDEEDEIEDEEEESDDELQDDDLGEEVWEEDDELSF